MADKKKEAAAAVDPGVASEKQNMKLEHTDDKRDQAAEPTVAGGVEPTEIPDGHSVTTRDDKLDLGVPMLPGSPEEQVGPEDALGVGPKRGDYTDRLGGDGYQPHEGGEPQKPRAADIGDEAGSKGGVTTGP